jgi:putative ABC transport system ATP-binding protein
VPTELLRVNGLTKAYHEGGRQTTVLAGAGFSLARGETASLVGASGVGKSTLLALLAGLMLPDAGSVCIDGDELTAMEEGARARLRAGKIGVVMQSDNLIPFLTATENVELAVTLAGGTSARDRARELLERFSLGDRVDDLPRRLSGGEAQRASLAVALVNEPDLLLADEVTAELDSASADVVLEVIRKAARERDLTVLMVTHSAELARTADRRLQVLDGRVVEW